MGHNKNHSFTGISDHDFTGLVPNQAIIFDGTNIISTGSTGGGGTSGNLWADGSGADSIIANNGTGNLAGGDYAIAEGFGTTANGVASHSEGTGTTANGDYSHAEGRDTRAIGRSSHAENEDTYAQGSFSHAEGWITSATTTGAHAEGRRTLASAIYSHAEGLETVASGQRSHAEGYQTTSSGHSSHAEGWVSTANGDSSHAEGRGTLAGGDYSHSEGFFTIANATSSHAGGSSSQALSTNSFAHGDTNIVTGLNSVAIGGNNLTNNTANSVMVPDLTVDGDFSGGTGGGVIYSGGTDLYDIFTSVDLWSASTGIRSIIVNSGSNNVAAGDYSISAGYSGETNSDYSAIIGGVYNSIIDSSDSSFVGGGGDNSISGSTYAGSVAGVSNTVINSSTAFIAGGVLSLIQDSQYGSIVGGLSCRLIDAQSSFVAGGTGFISGSTSSFVTGGGFLGFGNTIKDSNHSAIVGGYRNDITDSERSFIGGGYDNYISGASVGSAILAGQNLIVDSSFSYAFGGGARTKVYGASDDYVSVWGGSAGAASSANNTIAFDMKAGNGYFDGVADLGNADYAEYFEWSDGNLSNEDRVGYFVSLSGETVEKGNYNILGIVSATPAIVGDSASLKWNEIHLKDEFGRKLEEKYEIYKTKANTTGETIVYIDGENNIYKQVPSPGNLLGTLYVGDTDDKEYVKDYFDFKLNPLFNPNEIYIPRKERQEWSPIGLLGKLHVRTSEQITGPKISVDSNGMAINGTDYHVLKSIKDYDSNYGIVQVLFR